MQKGKKISTMQQFQGCCSSKVVVLAIRSNYMEQVMLRCLFYNGLHLSSGCPPPSNNQYYEQGGPEKSEYMGNESKYYLPFHKWEVGSMSWMSLQIYIKRFVVPESFSSHHALLVRITWSPCTVAKRTLRTSIVSGAANSCSSIRRKGRKCHLHTEAQ